MKITHAFLNRKAYVSNVAVVVIKQSPH